MLASHFPLLAMLVPLMQTDAAQANPDASAIKLPSIDSTMGSLLVATFIGLVYVLCVLSSSTESLLTTAAASLASPSTKPTGMRGYFRMIHRGSRVWYVKAP